MKKQRGITLIGLVVTIIVLLILAGVTIQTLTGDNGLIQKATTAKEENEKAKELELIKLAVSAAQVAGEGTITKDKLENELKSNFGDNKEVFENNTFFYCNGYRIYKDGKVEEGKLLPDEYQEVEYIESSGMQYINTKYYPDKDTNAKYKVSVLEYKIYGPHLLSSKNYFFPFFRNYKNDLCALRAGSTGINIYNLTYRTNTIYEYEAFKDNKIVINGEVVGYLDLTGEKDTVPLYLGTYGGVPNDSGGKAKAKFYYCIIYSSNTLVRNFIPCYSTAVVTDVNGIERPINTIGMFDSVNGQFYVNNGTGTFGYEMEDGTYVAPKNN